MSAGGLGNGATHTSSVAFARPKSDPTFNTQVPLSLQSSSVSQSP